MVVVDIGTGSGAYVWPMAEALENSGTLFAVDVQKDLLRRIHNEAQKRGFKNVKIIWADIEQPKSSKIAAHSADFVLVSNLLFQVEKKEALFAEAHRILKPSGRLAVIDWADSFNMMGPHKKDVVTKDRGLEYIKRGGFEPLREFGAGAHHWGIIARPAIGTARSA